MDTFQTLQITISIITALLVWNIGIKQNEINQRSLNISDFVEVFFMPQQVIYQKADTSQTEVKWNILVKNVAAYPIYLNSFTLNGVKHDVGNSAIPNQPDSWYQIPITDDILSKGEFSLTASFEDYQGKKYHTDGFGIFDGKWWSVKSTKRIEDK